MNYHVHVTVWSTLLVPEPDCVANLVSYRSVLNSKPHFAFGGLRQRTKSYADVVNNAVDIGSAPFRLIPIRLT